LKTWATVGARITWELREALLIQVPPLCHAFPQQMHKQTTGLLILPWNPRPGDFEAHRIVGVVSRIYWF
jgi:hypothetical protein